MKLSTYLRKKEKKNPLLVACDVYRPAAIEQLRVLGEQIKVPVYSEIENKNPIEIAQNAIAHAKREGRDVVIIDTAGRLAVDEQMMDEIAAPREEMSPYAPRIISMQVDPDHIRTIIGPGGKTINRIIADTGVKIDIDDTGKVLIMSADGDSLNKAKDIITGIWYHRTIQAPATWSKKKIMLHFGAVYYESEIYVDGIKEE